MLLDSRPAKDRFQGRYIGIVAPERAASARFLFEILHRAIARACPLDLGAIADWEGEEGFLADVYPRSEALDVPDTVALKLAVEGAVAQMTDWQRTVLILRLQGYRFTEIGRHFSRTEGSPRVAYHRACEHLRQYLVEEQGDGDA